MWVTCCSFQYLSWLHTWSRPLCCLYRQAVLCTSLLCVIPCHALPQAIAHALPEPFIPGRIKGLRTTLCL